MPEAKRPARETRPSSDGDHSPATLLFARQSLWHYTFCGNAALSWTVQY